MNISFNGFRSLLEARRKGVLPGATWMAYEIACPECAARDTFVAFPYAKGFACRRCGHNDPDFVWPPGRSCQDGPFLSPVYERTRRNFFAPRAQK